MVIHIQDKAIFAFAIAFFLITKTTGDLQEIYAPNVQVESKFS